MMGLFEKFQKYSLFYTSSNHNHHQQQQQQQQQKYGKITPINRNLMLILITVISIINFSKGNELNDGDLEQINGIMGMNDVSSSPEILSQQLQQQQQQHQKQKEEVLQNQNGLQNYEKRSLENLHGTWSKRTFDNPNEYYQWQQEQQHQQQPQQQQHRQQQENDDFDTFANNDDNVLSEYNDDTSYIPSSAMNRIGILPFTVKYSNEKILIPDQLLSYRNEQKRGWKSMSGAWGKRLSNNGDNWNRFRGSWGKREPGWNNLKGLWGKRATNWNKLQSAWGKRDHVQQNSY